MKLNELRSVAAVSEHGLSVTKAAQHLHATQSGISRHVIDVEQVLGVDLFEIL